MSTIACGVLLIAIFVYVFWPERHVEAQTEKTRLDFLEERREVVYENLKDLNFEYRAGKFPESDYLAMKNSLEEEAAAILAEIARLEQAVVRRGEFVLDWCGGAPPETHFKDDRFNRPETAGAAAFIRGIVQSNAADWKRLERGAALLDDLYGFFSKLPGRNV